jgi:hypothetical protein
VGHVFGLHFCGAYSPLLHANSVSSSLTLLLNPWQLSRQRPNQLTVWGKRRQANSPRIVSRDV